MARINYGEIASFGDCVRKLNGRDRRKLRNNVWIEKEDDVMRIILHHTAIITYYRSGTVELNSGGFRTVTTKANMCRFSPVGVGQRKGEWYVRTNWGTEFPFVDGMRLSQEWTVSPV